MAAKKKKKAAKKATKAKPKKAAKKKVQAVPPQYSTVTPHLIVSPCAEAIDFYGKAFGAKLIYKMEMGPGLIAHAEIRVGDAIVMMSDQMPPQPGMPDNRRTPKNAGGITTGGLMMYVKDVDAAFKKATDAGAKAVMPPMDMFWGDRYGQLEDPYGHVWAMATHVKDMSPKEMAEAMKSAGPPQG